MRNKITHLLLNEYFLLTLIVLGGFLVRLYKINNPLADWHSFRQVDTASVTRIYVEDGINLLYPRYYDISSIQSGIFNPQGFRFVEFPIFNVVHAVLVKTFPGFSLEVWGRLLSVGSSLVSTVFIYFIGKKFLKKQGGLVAAFFFAFLPFNIYFSRVILPEPLAVSFYLISLWFYIKFIEKDKILSLYISALFLAISLLIKPYIIFLTLPPVYLTVDKYSLSGLLKVRGLLIKLAIFSAIALIPFFLWRVWINQYPQGIPFFEWLFNGDKIRFRPAFWRWIFGERIGRLILGIWGIFPFSAGLVGRQKNHFVNFLFLGTLLYLLIIATANVRHDYYQIFIIPAVVLIMAQGVVWLLESPRANRFILKFLLVFSTVMMLGMGFYQVKEFYKINHPEIIEVGETINQLIPQDAQIIAPYNGDTTFLYHSKRFGWAAVDDSFDNIIKKGADYYVSLTFNDNDTKYILSKYKVVSKTDQYVLADLHQPL